MRRIQTSPSKLGFKILDSSSVSGGPCIMTLSVQFNDYSAHAQQRRVPQLALVNIHAYCPISLTWKKMSR